MEIAIPYDPSRSISHVRKHSRALLGMLVRSRIRELVFNCVELIAGGSEPKRKKEKRKKKNRNKREEMMKFVRQKKKKQKRSWQRETFARDI